jgi:hypothetical protein
MAAIVVLTLCGASVRAGQIRGVVLELDGRPVGQATVVLCDQKTGIPVSKDTHKPFTEKGLNLQNLATVLTDEQGAFSFDEVPDGLYRLVAQRWPPKPAVQNVFEVNGEEIVLCGVADKITVPSEAAQQLRLMPLGEASLTLDEEFPNNGGLLLISTRPPAADPVLMFLCWQGPFLQHMIGGNLMPKGVTKVRGLPPGRVYLSVFANDNNGGIGTAAVDVKAGQTIRAEYIPIVCGWSNGRHDPPKELEQTFDEVKQIAQQGLDQVPAFLERLLAEKGAVLKPSEGSRNELAPYAAHLNVVVTLPSGREVRFADVLASIGYLQLQRNVEMRKKRVPRTQ